VRLLAVSFMLPPMLYPQAIQIGRLLMQMDAEIGAVTGRGAAGGLDCYEDLDRKLSFHVDVPFRPRLSGLPHQLAVRMLPFYGRAPDEYRGWVPLAEAAVAAKLAETGFRPDAIVTFGEPMSDHLLGARLKRSLGLPWIAHFSDPWVDNPFRSGQPLANLVNRRLEAETIRLADRVVFTSRETVDLVMGKYPASLRGKVALLPHSFDAALYPSERRPDDRFVIRHIGNYYGNRTPYPLFRALRLLHDDSPALLDGVRVELVGRVPRGMDWHPSFRALPDGIVTVRGSVGYRESLRLMTDADLLLVMDAPSDLSVFLPSKLIDYVGSGTPIMGIVPPGTSEHLIRRLGGDTADPRSPKDVAAILRRGIEGGRGSQRPWGNPAVRAEFEPRRNAEAFEAIIRDCVDTVRG
jgi:hypothetical protein